MPMAEHNCNGMENMIVLKKTVLSVFALIVFIGAAALAETRSRPPSSKRLNPAKRYESPVGRARHTVGARAWSPPLEIRLDGRKVRRSSRSRQRESGLQFHPRPG